MGADSTRAPVGATTFTNKDDAAILAAWDRRAAAYLAHSALPHEPAEGQGSTPEQLAQWAIVDAAEAEINAAIASTPRGAEIQLWTAATYIFNSIEDEDACYSGDLKYFEAKSDRHDWTERLLIATLRSLREQGK